MHGDVLFDAVYDSRWYIKYERGSSELDSAIAAGESGFRATYGGQTAIGHPTSPCWTVRYLHQGAESSSQIRRDAVGQEPCVARFCTV